MGPQNTFDLGNIIRPSNHSSLDEAECPSARTGVLRPFCHILGVESDARLGHPVEGSNDDLSLSARFFDDLSRFNILQLRKKEGLIDMKAAGLGRTFKTPCPDLCSTHVVIDLCTPSLLHSLLSWTGCSHPVRPRR